MTGDDFVVTFRLMMISLFVTWPLPRETEGGLRGILVRAQGDPAGLVQATFNPAVFGIVAIVLIVAGLIAAWVPAWKATTIDPVEAMAAE